MMNTHSLSSFAKKIHGHHPFHGLKQSLTHLFAKLSGVKNSSIRLDSQPYKFYKVFSNNYLTQSQQNNQTGFISHFGPRQEPALVLHGNDPHSKPGPGFIYYKGSCVDYKKPGGEKAVHKLLNVHDFVAAVKKDFGLDLHRSGNTGDNPLHLICCYSGGDSPESLASQLSRELDRNIVCYGEGKRVTTFPSLKTSMEETAKVYCEERFLNRKVLAPLKETIHIPDNEPGESSV